MKNVIAIACGMMTGAGFAENTRAALITRGLDELKALAEALGARRETVTGLSGVGDLTLTCSSTTSRNMALGVQLGEGTPREDCFGGKPVVVEGEVNAKSVTDLARRLGVEMPICETVRSILHDGVSVGDGFARLWARPIEAEPRSMDISFDHPATDQDIATLAERISCPATSDLKAPIFRPRTSSWPPILTELSWEAPTRTASASMHGLKGSGTVLVSSS